MNTRKNRIDYALLSNPFKKPKPQYKAASVTCDKEVQQAKRLALERYINQCAKKPELNHAVIQVSSNDLCYILLSVA